MPGPYEGRWRYRIGRIPYSWRMGQTTHGSEEMVLVRIRGRRTAITDTEFYIDVFHVPSDGMWADHQPRGDLTVGASGGQVHEHFSFTVRQHRPWLPFRVISQPVIKRAHMFRIRHSA